MAIVKAIVRTERLTSERLAETNFDRSNDRLDYKDSKADKNGVSPEQNNDLAYIVKAIVRLIVRTIKRRTITT
jgi:hypothetical protein